MSNDQRPGRGPERPRFEPEIIPPERDNLGSRDPFGTSMRFEGREGTQRILIARPGWLSVILALLIVGLIAAVMFVVLAGVVLIWVPLLVAGIVLALLMGAIRYRWRRIQAWWAGGR